MANLLNDAEALSGHSSKNPEIGLTSITHMKEKSTETADVKADIPQETHEISETSKSADTKTEEENASKSVNTVKKGNLSKSADTAKTDAKLPTSEDIKIPTSADIQNAIKDSGSDFAPIFAMYHGKIVPLGKLPDTSFKKSNTEDLPTDTPTNSPIKKNEATTNPTNIPAKPIEAQSKTIDSPTKENIPTETMNTKTVKYKDISGTKRSLSEENNRHIVPSGDITGSVRDKTEKDPVKLTKLQQYLTNLDGHIPATGGESRGVAAKDEVIFPEDETGSPKSDIINHVKGVVLDDGKIVSVNNNHLESTDEPVKQVADSSDSQQKYFVSDDGTLTPLTKSKPEIGEAVTRDVTTAGGATADGQKTVALSLDVLKDLLKKTDSKISLASLLNKAPETKSETPTQEDEDPGKVIYFNI